MKKTLNILRWIFGILFILAGIGGMTSSAGFAISVLLLGVSFLPVVWEIVEKKQKEMKKRIKYAVQGILFVLCLITVPETPEDVKASRHTVEAEAQETQAEPEEAENSEKEKAAEEEKTGEEETAEGETAERETAAGEISAEETAASETTRIVSETSASEDVTAVGDMTVHFLDVGQGLAVFVQAGEQNLIYDGGDRDASSFVVAYLKEQGVETIDYLINSHYDADHLAGLIGCLNAFDVKNVIGSDYVHNSQMYESFMNAVAGEGLTVQHPAVGEEFAIGTGTFTILAPETVNPNESNDNSVAIKLTNGENSFILVGDAESSSESAMCRSGIDLTCDVLVPGHHGSATATSWEFLQETLPEYAVISCGKDNQYGHPHKDTMDKLESTETRIFRTDIQGTIVAVSDGSSLTWSQEPCDDYSPGDAEDAGTQPDTEQKMTVESKPTATPEPTVEVQEPEETEMVWISATGEKYHNKPNCGRMNPNKARQMSRADADARGYEPCKKCY